MAVEKICFSQVISILQALTGKYSTVEEWSFVYRLLPFLIYPAEPMTTNKIAKSLNADLDQVKHVLEMATKNGLLVKVKRKFKWSHQMKYPKSRYRSSPGIKKISRGKRRRTKKKINCI